MTHDNDLQMPTRVKPELSAEVESEQGWSDDKDTEASSNIDEVNHLILIFVHGLPF